MTNERVRERVREVVKPVAVRERVRVAPSAPTVRVRVRERPRGPQPSDLDPDAYELHPNIKARQRELAEWRATTRVREVVREPPLPEQWPSGSAMLRGPNTPGYRRHPKTWGEPDEKNPNLIGRAVPAIADRGGYHLWRWRFMKYEYVGKFRDHGEMFGALRK